MLETFIGSFAAVCTTLSYVPQVHKCWTSGQVDDLSSKMLIILAAGLCLWILYGVLKSDWVIIVANLVSLSLTAILLTLKLRKLPH